MADDTANGTSGDAPRTLFARGRGGKRKRGAAAESPLENYPPADPDELDPAGTADGGSAPTGEPGAPELCPSCAEPLVPGAMFCGECGTRAVPASAAGESDQSDQIDDGSDDESDREAFVAFADGAESDAEADADPAVAAQVDRAQATHGIDGIDEGGVDDDGPAGSEPAAAELTDDDLVEEELVATAPVAAVAADEVVDADQADAETVDATESEGDTQDDAHDGAVPLIVAGGAAVAAGAMVADAAEPADAAEAAAPPSYGEPAAAGAGPAGGASKKGVWVGVAAVVLLVVGAVGAYAVTSGSSPSKKSDQLAADSSPTSTSTTEASSSTTESTATTVAEVPVTDPTVDPNTVTTASTVKTTPTTGAFVPPPPPPPTQPGSARLSAQCPTSTLRQGSAITVINQGTAAGDFKISGNVAQVHFSPGSGSVPAGAGTNVFVSFSGHFDGTVSITMILAGSGVQHCPPVTAQGG